MDRVVYVQICDDVCKGAWILSRGEVAGKKYLGLDVKGFIEESKSRFELIENRNKSHKLRSTRVPQSNSKFPWQYIVKPTLYKQVLNIVIDQQFVRSIIV
jgi:hypothetical protein